ncbi:ferredoxin [Actinophytocola xanthii]|uniref:Ferredoxin n=1 Tax=Actinophytocola xanthii TaxID=1912961 RepID=A0A1Q8CY68_9PSEU|nr:ferredoxin [Actinophytocola xanthii]OLF19298.1 ferredoxin [Actinophytocola xanthii]
MRVHVDMELCQSHGQCVFAAPAVFSFDEDDNLVHQETAAESMREAVVRAAAACPVRAVHVGPPDEGDVSGGAAA